MGSQFVDFALCIDALTTSVKVEGGLNATFKVGSDINSLNGPGVVLNPAALGQRSCGYLEMSLPAAVYGVLMFFVALGFGFLIRGRGGAGASQPARATDEPATDAAEVTPPER